MYCDLSIVEKITERAYVLSEDHRAVGEGTPRQVLNDPTLLISSGLMVATS